MSLTNRPHDTHFILPAFGTCDSFTASCHPVPELSNLSSEGNGPAVVNLHATVLCYRVRTLASVNNIAPSP